MAMKFDSRRTYPYYQPPREGNKILIVLDNPTWKEICLGRPAVCETGDNLGILLWMLNNMNSDALNDYSGQFVKNDVCIVNAITQCGDFEGVPIETLVKAHLINVIPLKAAAKVAELILVFGSIAKNVYKRIMATDNAKVIFLYHLSPKVVNRFNNVKSLNEWLGNELSMKPTFDDSYLRIAVFARFIVDCLSNIQLQSNFAMYSSAYTKSKHTKER